MTYRQFEGILLTIGGEWTGRGVMLGSWLFSQDGNNITIQSKHGTSSRYRLASIIDTKFENGILEFKTTKGYQYSTVLVPVDNSDIELWEGEA